MANQIPQYEIPPQVREMAEKSVDEAKKAFETFVQQAHKAVSTIETQTTHMQSSAKDLGAKAVSFAEANINASFEFAGKMLRAKDMTEFATLQQDFVKSQMSTLSEQAKEMGATTTKIVSEATKANS